MGHRGDSSRERVTQYLSQCTYYSLQCITVMSLALYISTISVYISRYVYVNHMCLLSCWCVENAGVSALPAVSDRRTAAGLGVVGH